MKRSKMLKVPKIHPTKLQEAENFLNTHKRGLINLIIKKKILRGAQPQIGCFLGNVIGKTAAGYIKIRQDPSNAAAYAEEAAQAYTIEGSKLETLNKLNRVTQRLHPRELNWFFDECIRQAPEQVINKWHNLMTRQKSHTDTIKKAEMRARDKAVKSEKQDHLPQVGAQTLRPREPRTDCHRPERRY